MLLPEIWGVPVAFFLLDLSAPDPARSCGGEWAGPEYLLAGIRMGPASFSVSCDSAKVSANSGSHYPIEWGLRHAGSWHHLCEH